jgi:hypothetical protein
MFLILNTSPSNFLHKFLMESRDEFPFSPLDFVVLLTNAGFICQITTTIDEAAY